MTGQEIRNKINFIYEEIDKISDKDQFVLNKNIERFYSLLYEIQEKCEHEFENGICIYCDKEIE